MVENTAPQYSLPTFAKAPSAFLVQQTSRLPSPDCLQVVFSFYGYRDQVRTILRQLFQSGGLLYENRVKNYLTVEQDNVSQR